MKGSKAADYADQICRHSDAAVTAAATKWGYCGWDAISAQDRRRWRVLGFDRLAWECWDDPNSSAKTKQKKATAGAAGAAGAAISRTAQGWAAAVPAIHFLHLGVFLLY